jgi:hypothetical protein
VSRGEFVTGAKRSNVKIMFNVILPLLLLISFCPLFTITMLVSHLFNDVAMVVTYFNQ